MVFAIESSCNCRRQRFPVERAVGTHVAAAVIAIRIVIAVTDVDREDIAPDPSMREVQTAWEAVADWEHSRVFPEGQVRR